MVSQAQVTIWLSLPDVTTAHAQEPAANKIQAAFCKMAEMPCSVVDCSFTENVSVLMSFIVHSRLFIVHSRLFIVHSRLFIVHSRLFS